MKANCWVKNHGLQLHGILQAVATGFDCTPGWLDASQQQTRRCQHTINMALSLS